MSENLVAQAAIGMVVVDDNISVAALTVTQIYGPLLR